MFGVPEEIFIATLMLHDVRTSLASAPGYSLGRWAGDDRGGIPQLGITPGSVARTCWLPRLVTLRRCPPLRRRLRQIFVKGTARVRKSSKMGSLFLFSMTWMSNKLVAAIQNDCVGERKRERLVLDFVPMTRF
jgi:hypothetical protein